MVSNVFKVSEFSQFGVDYKCVTESYDNRILRATKTQKVVSIMHIIVCTISFSRVVRRFGLLYGLTRTV